MKIQIRKSYSISLLLMMFLVILILRMFDFRIQTYTICAILILVYLFINSKCMYFSIKKFGFKAILIFTFLAGITLICVIYSKTRISYFFQIVLIFSLYILFLTYYNKNGKLGYEWLYSALYKVSIIFSLVGIYEGIIRENLFDNYIYINYFAYTEHTASYRISLMFIHPIVYAHFSLIMFIYGLYYDKDKYRILSYVLLTINIYLTKSRSTWIALIIVMVIFFIKRLDIRKYRFKRKAMGTFAFLIIAFLLGNYFFVGGAIIQNIWNRFLEAFSSNSYILRISAINNLMNTFLYNNSLFGILFGNGNGAATIMMENSISVQGIGHSSMTTTDNFYLSFIYNFGIISMIILLIYIVSILKKALITCDELQEYVALSLIGSSITIFFYDVFNWELLVFIIISQISFYNILVSRRFKKNSNPIF